MKVLNVIRSVLAWIMVVIAVCMMIFTVVSVLTFDRADRNLFGYKAFIVLSDSMSKTDFDAGDLVLVKEVDPSTLKEGDIIAYSSQNEENYGATVTHKIRRLTTDANGTPDLLPTVPQQIPTMKPWLHIRSYWANIKSISRRSERSSGSSRPLPDISSAYLSRF